MPLLHHYIYMYQNRTPDKNGQSPLTDISFYGKNPQDFSYTDGAITYYQTVAVNTDEEIQDLNQSCGFWSDYIHLIKHYSIESSLPGSLIGTGSITVILILLGVTISVGLYFIIKKKYIITEDLYDQMVAEIQARKEVNA